MNFTTDYIPSTWATAKSIRCAVRPGACDAGHNITMKLIDNNTSTEVDFNPPHRFSTIQTLKMIANTYAFMREFISDQPLDELIESLQIGDGALIVTWKRKPSTNEMWDIEWIWEHVCEQHETRHIFEWKEIA